MNNSVAAEGVKLDFGSGTASTSSFWAAVEILGTTLVGTQITTSPSSAMSAGTITGENVALIRGYLVCNGTGTMIVRAAENSHATGTLTVEAGSHWWVDDTP